VPEVQQVLGSVFEIDVTQQNFGKAKGCQQHQHAFGGFEDRHHAETFAMVVFLGPDCYVPTTHVEVAAVAPEMGCAPMHVSLTRNAPLAYLDFDAGGCDAAIRRIP
jgi:hypothetical protein